MDPTGQYAQVLLCAGPQAAVCAGVAGATLLYIWWQHGDDVVDVCEQAIDDLFQPPYILNNDGGRVKTPNVGPPNSRHVNPNNGQIRDYGPDGRPIRDIDFNHDHGSGSPHGHDWGEDENGNPERGPARPIRPEDNIGDDS